MKKLKLGQELSKNEQKKIMGGGVVCFVASRPPGQQYVTINSTAVNCSNGPAYCSGAYSGVMTSCW